MRRAGGRPVSLFARSINSSPSSMMRAAIVSSNWARPAGGSSRVTVKAAAAARIAASTSASVAGANVGSSGSPVAGLMPRMVLGTEATHWPWMSWRPVRVQFIAIRVGKRARNGKASRGRASNSHYEPERRSATGLSQPNGCVPPFLLCCPASPALRPKPAASRRSVKMRIAAAGPATGSGGHGANLLIMLLLVLLLLLYQFCRQELAANGEQIRSKSRSKSKSKSLPAGSRPHPLTAET